MDWKKIIKDIRVRSVSEEAISLARKYGYRVYMVERYIRLLGLEDTKRLLDAFEKPLKPVIRCNDLRIDCDKLAFLLEDLGFRLEYIPWSIHGYRVVEEPPRPSIGATHEYLKGYYYVHRDAAPLVAALILEPSPEDKVLDGCAAPGGKATHLAQLMKGRGLVVANDIVLYRLRALVGHVLRMGLWNIVVTWSDLRKMPRITRKRYDKVLLDVPCSAEGAIMFDKKRKKKTTQLDLARIVAREIELLNAGLDLLKDNGILLYVTCSIAPEENEYVITRILEMRNDVDVVEPPRKLFNWSPGITRFHKLSFDDRVRKCIRIWPHIHNMMGMFMCLLSKTRT